MKQAHHIHPIEPVEGPEERPPLEVALLTWEYPPIPTAKGRTASEVAHALAAHGVNVRVFTMDRDDKVSTDHERIEVIGCAGRITGLRRLMRCTPGLDHIAAAAAFRERVHEEHDRRPFDLIETTNWGAPAAMLLDCGLPMVVRNSAPLALDAGSRRSIGRAISTRIASGLEARQAQAADAVISNSRAHASRIKDWYDLRPGAIHMVVPLSVRPSIRQAGGSTPFPPAHARLRLAFIGDEQPRKALVETLSAFQILVNEARRDGEALPELHIIGLDNGRLDTKFAEHAIPREVQNQIFDYGRLTDSSKAHVIARCHGIVAPSRYQSFGSVYHEAAAFGRPLVACAEDPTASEFIQRYGCGVLAATCTPEDIATEIKALFHDRDRVMQCRKAGLEASDAWTREELGARTLQVYRRAMQLAPIEIPGARQTEIRNHPARRRHHA